MRWNSQRGTVLVASLVILALLTILGTGSLLTATLDTKMASNMKVSREAFYATEAGLDAGANYIVEQFKGSDYQPVAAPTNPITPSTGAGDPFDSPLGDFDVTYSVWAADAVNVVGAIPGEFPLNGLDNGMPLAWRFHEYQIDATAESSQGKNDASEILQILEIPLTQYFAYTLGDMSIHPHQTMQMWGRIHAVGDLYLHPVVDAYMNDYDLIGNTVPTLVTAEGDMILDKMLQQGTAPAGGGTDSFWMRFDSPNPPTLVPAIPPTADREDVMAPTSGAPLIDETNQVEEEDRFKGVNDGITNHLRVNIDTKTAISMSDDTAIQPGQYFSIEALNGSSLDTVVDTFHITSTVGVAPTVWFTRYGQAPQDVSNDVWNMQADAATATDINLTFWPAGARTRANGSLATTPAQAGTPNMGPGTIIYSSENPCPQDDEGKNFIFDSARVAGVAYDPLLAAGTDFDNNPLYPVVLETEDPRDGRDVDFLVIDVQRLSQWYEDRIDFELNGTPLTGTPDMSNRRLLIYASHTGSTPTAGNALAAVKLIGSRAGRTWNNSGAHDRQTDPTFVVPTTIVTDNPVYFAGDFNAPGGGGPPAMGSAVFCDAATVLSNSWAEQNNANIFDQLGGPVALADRDVESGVGTTVNTALFTGRFDFSAGGAGREAGLQNTLRLIEGWNGERLDFTGALITLWTSRYAAAPYVAPPGGVYTAPVRHFGWDMGFSILNPVYEPPYVPNVYSTERASWRK